MRGGEWGGERRECDSEWGTRGECVSGEPPGVCDGVRIGMRIGVCCATVCAFRGGGIVCGVRCGICVCIRRGLAERAGPRAREMPSRPGTSIGSWMGVEGGDGPLPSAHGPCPHGPCTHRSRG